MLSNSTLTVKMFNDFRLAIPSCQSSISNTEKNVKMFAYQCDEQMKMRPLVLYWFGWFGIYV